MSTDPRDWDALADRLAWAAVADGQPTRWYQELWASAERDEVDMPWDRNAPYPPLVGYLDSGSRPPGRAVVVGAGRGADAEELAARGWRTTAFDIAPSAVRLARAKHPSSPVAYRVADLLAPPADLRGRFDLVVEVFTVQALEPSLRRRAIDGVRALLASGGEALVVQFVRRPGEPDTGPPWLLTEQDMAAFAGDGYDWVSLAQGPHPVRPDGPATWVGVLRRQRR